MPWQNNKIAAAVIQALKSGDIGESAWSPPSVGDSLWSWYGEPMEFIEDSGGVYVKDKTPGVGDFRLLQPSRYYDNIASDYVYSSSRVTTGAVSQLSIAVWVRPANTTGVKTIAAEGHGTDKAWEILQNGTSYVVRLFSNGTTVMKDYSVVSAVTDTWTHFGFTFDETQASADQLKLYVNGVEVAPVKTIDNDAGTIYDTPEGFGWMAYETGLTNFVGQTKGLFLGDGVTLTAEQVLSVESGVYPGVGVFYHSEEGGGAFSLPAKAGELALNIQTGSEVTFHEDSLLVDYSGQNTDGYLVADGSTHYYDSAATQLIPAGVFVPRDESEPTKAACYTAPGVKADLEFSGKCPRSGKVEELPCFTGDGATTYATYVGLNLGTPTTYSCNMRMLTNGLGVYLDTTDTDDDGIQLLSQGDGRLKWTHNAIDLFTVNTDYEDGTWLDVAVDWDGADITMVVTKGDRVETVTTPAATPINNVTDIRLGARSHTSPTTFFDGSLCGVTLATDGTTIIDSPCTEQAGDLLTNLAVNGIHAEIESASLVAAWGTKQNVYPGILNGAGVRMIFDGVDDHVAVGSLTITKGSTVVVRWIPEVTGVNQTLVDADEVAGGFWLFQVSTDKVRARFRTGLENINSTNTVNENELNTVILNIGETTGTIYLNGVAGAATAGTMEEVSAACYIGALNATTSLVSSPILEVLLYNRELSSEERTVVDSGSNPSGATHHWRNIGNSNEDWKNLANEGVNDGVVAGSPEQAYYPSNDGIVDVFGLPVTDGPGKQIGNSEINMFYQPLDPETAKLPAPLLAAGTNYVQGTDDNPADSLIVRVDPVGDTRGDDRHAVYDPPLTGEDLANAQAYGT